jgi:hypothetical protein
MTIRGTIQSKQGLIGKVVNSPVNRTSISSPNFKPTANIAMSDITDVQITSKSNGEILIYNASSEKFELNKITIDQFDLENINGGRF